MAEQRVLVEGMWPPGSSLPVAISGTLPAGTALPVAQAAPAKSSAPLVGNVLAGSADGDQTLISLTAGQIWYGFFQLNASLTGTSKSCAISVSCLGSTATPDSDTVIAGLSLATTATTTAISGTTNTLYMYIYCGTSDNDIHVSVTGDPVVMTATAYGFLLA